MAIGPPGLLYDINRDMYFDSRASQERYEYERAMHQRRMEEEYRRAQQSAYYTTPQEQQAKLVNTAPKPDPKDPLSFLSKADNKLLLTGETS